MPYCTIESMFSSPWGLVEHRKKDIENGHFGVFEKVYQEELRKRFWGIEVSATYMGVSRSTAFRWLRKVMDAQWITHNNETLYYARDVKAIKKKRDAIKGIGKK